MISKTNFRSTKLNFFLILFKILLRIRAYHFIYLLYIFCDRPFSDTTNDTITTSWSVATRRKYPHRHQEIYVIFKLKITVLLASKTIGTKIIWKSFGQANLRSLCCKIWLLNTKCFPVLRYGIDNNNNKSYRFKASKIRFTVNIQKYSRFVFNWNELFKIYPQIFFNKKYFLYVLRFFGKFSKIVN